MKINLSFLGLVIIRKQVLTQSANLTAYYKEGLKHSSENINTKTGI